MSEETNNTEEFSGKKRGRKPNASSEELDLSSSKKKSPVTRHKPSKVVQLFTFDQYAVSKGIKSQRIPGMRAFVGNTRIKRSMEEWDAFFEKY